MLTEVIVGEVLSLNPTETHLILLQGSTEKYQFHQSNEINSIDHPVF
jgi:hypothetical protein